ncbi:MAG: zf-TFIIB domain-containing protein [Candidatus Binatia bacterium]|nr:zf-TFIIB domain-containing protein [Candidatus Binatia bacterium]
MQCPKCQTESFVTRTIRGISVDRCTNCNGIWFDERELASLLNEDARALTPLRGATTSEELNSKRGRCPRDATPLLRMYSAINSEVVVDTCLQCHGIWLDGGEFDALFARVHRRST